MSIGSIRKDMQPKLFQCIRRSPTLQMDRSQPLNNLEKHRVFYNVQFVKQLYMIVQGDDQFSVDSVSIPAAAADGDEEFSSADKKLVSVTLSPVTVRQFSLCCALL